MCKKIRSCIIAVLFGVLLAATAFDSPTIIGNKGCPTQTTNVYPTAGVSSYLDNCLENTSSPTAGITAYIDNCLSSTCNIPNVTQNTGDLVKSSAYNDVVYELESTIENFYMWCTSSDYLTMDITHSLDGQVMSCINSVVSNDTYDSQVTVKNYNYVLDMFYNVSQDIYIANLSCGSNSSGYVYVQNPKMNLKTFLQSKIVYNTAPKAVHHILDTISDKTYTSEIQGDSIILTAVLDISDMPVNTTLSSPLQSCIVTATFNTDLVSVVIDLQYVSNSSEQYTYSLSTGSDSSLGTPESYSMDTGELQRVFDKMRGY